MNSGPRGRVSEISPTEIGLFGRNWLCDIWGGIYTDMGYSIHKKPVVFN